MTISPKYERYAFIIILAIALYLSFLLLKGFLAAIAIGAIIAYFVYPFYSWIYSRTKSKNLAAFVVSATALLIVGTVVAILVPQMIDESQKFANLVQEFGNSQKEMLEQCSTEESLYCSLVSPYASTIEEGGEGVGNLVRASSGYLISSLTGNLSEILLGLLKLAVMGFAVFYFLENGERVVKRFMEILPLHQKHEDVLEKRVKDTLDAVVKGNIITSIMQGVLGGLIFYMLGISSAFMWGVIMTILAFIPTTGAALVWLPAAAILIVTGSVVKGVVLLVFGFAVLGYIDNILKPKMIGNKIQISSFMMFLSVLGGLSVFGIVGLFLGPLIISLTIVLVNFFEKEVMHG